MRTKLVLYLKVLMFFGLHTRSTNQSILKYKKTHNAQNTRATKNMLEAENGKPMHLAAWMLPCKDEESAEKLLESIATRVSHGARKHSCEQLDYGFKADHKNVVCLIELWHTWVHLDRHLERDVEPLLDQWNSEYLAEPFDQDKHVVRINTVS